MFLKKILLTAALCSSTLLSHANTLKVGAMSGPEGALADTAAKVAKEKYGLDVEIIKFNDYVAPNIALHDGSLDANAINSGPYMDNLIKTRGLNLVNVGNTFVYPIAAYSNSITSLDELTDGASIAVPNDPVNEGRALLLLNKYKLIKLKDPSKMTANVLDIAENPHNYKIIELDGAQLPRILDQVDLAFLNNTFAVVAGLKIDDAIVVEDKDSPYVNIISAREDNKDNSDVKTFVKAYQSPEVEAQAIQTFQGGAVKGWD